MAIELKVVGETAEGVRESLRHLCGLFGVAVIPDPTIEQVRPHTVVASVEVEPPPVAVVEEKPKTRRGRKRKEAVEALAEDRIAPPVIEEALQPSEPKPVDEFEEKAAREVQEIDAPEPTELDEAALKALRDQTVSRLQEIYLQPGGAERVAEIVRKHGGGVRKVMDIAPEAFPAIAAELDAS